MKFLIINTDYPQFLKWLYSRNKGLEYSSYNKQLDIRMKSLFAESDFYSKNLIKLGHEACDIFANNEYLQKAWAREHIIKLENENSIPNKLNNILGKGAFIANQTPLKYFKPIYGKVMPASYKPAWFYQILKAQVEYYKPDIIYNHSITEIESNFFKKIKSNYKMLVGQFAASRLPDGIDLSAYNLFISSFPPTVEYFKRRGVAAEFNKLGFEPSILNSLNKGKKIYDLTFIGSLFPVHSTRIKLLEFLCEEFPNIKIWGPGVDHLSKDSLIRDCYNGQAWGIEMYQILYNSKITINHHGNIPPFANNLRLYEATGVGSSLITDWKENLSDILIPGKEVLAYKTNEDCAKLINYYMDNDVEREAIAYAGQQRTINEHNYYNRMQSMVNIVNKYLQ